MKQEMSREEDARELFFKQLRKKAIITKDQITVPYNWVKEVVRLGFTITPGAMAPPQERHSEIVEKIRKNNPGIYNILETWSILKKGKILRNLDSLDQLKIMQQYYETQYLKRLDNFRDLITFTQDHENELVRNRIILKHG